MGKQIFFTGRVSKLPMIDNTSTYTSTWSEENQCKHLNGWYGTIHFLFWSIPVFCCTDCGDFLYGKEYKKFRQKDIIKNV